MAEVRATFLSTMRRLFAVALLFLLLALVPSAPLETTVALARLMASSAPERVAVPVEGVRPDRLHGSWGQPRSGGRRHEGIDIFAPRGTRVVSSVGGMVWRVGADPLGGQVVWLLGPGRQLHYFAHLDRFANVRAGDLVRTGDTLGYVGTTGNARGGPPHLHYGIYGGAGGAIDPYPLLVRPAAT